MFAATRILRSAAHAERTPMIKFIGKRSIPCTFTSMAVLPTKANNIAASVDHTPHAHPAAPNQSLPEGFGTPSSSSSSSSSSFSSYRDKAQQHGPLGRSSTGSVGGASGHSLGSVAPKSGEFFDRSELPLRFRRTPYSQAEIDAIETGGATMVC